MKCLSNFLLPALSGGRILQMFPGLLQNPFAALRFNFVAAVPEGLAGQGLCSALFARPASGSFYETIDWTNFREFIKVDLSPFPGVADPAPL